MLASPIYWLLMSIAAWQALYELIVRPHYWQKTRHGLLQAAVADTMPLHVAPKVGSPNSTFVPEAIHVGDQ